VTNGQEATIRRATLATLVWTVPVRILDVSRSGCRLEAARWLEIGTSGQLRLALGGRTHQDDVRIARCQLREGSGQNYFLGAELLRIRRLDARSIRMAIGELIGEHAASEHPPPANPGLLVPDRGSEQMAKGVSRAPPRPD
jgi:hypothetical protein